MRHALIFLETWSYDPVPTVELVAVAGGYLWAARRVGHQHPASPWPRRSTAFFLSGMALVWVAVLGPIGSYDDVFFWAHMVQHLLLVMVAAPLLLLGQPLLLILRVSSRKVRRDYIVPALRSRVFGTLANPYFGWLLFAGVLVGTHFSGFFDYSLRHPLVHDLIEHPLFLGAALVFYYPLLPGNPGPRRIEPAWRALSLFLMMIPETMTGFFIYASHYLLYPFYETVARPFGPSPLTDQQLAGALMWSLSMVIDAVWVSIAVVDWLHSEEKRSHRIDIETLAAARRPLSGSL